MYSLLEVASLDVGTADFGEPIPEEQVACIEVRHACSFGLWRDLEISIDEQRAGQGGRTSPGFYRVFPGWHTLGARMDWVRTQTVSVYLEANERAVFRCGMEPMAGRVWSIAIRLLCLAVGAATIVTLFGSLLPGPVRDLLNLVAPCCLVPLGVCELIVFSRLRPGSPPGQLLSLFRHPQEPDREELR